MNEKSSVLNTQISSPGRAIRCSGCQLRCFELCDNVAAHIAALSGHRGESENGCLRDTLGAALELTMHGDGASVMDTFPSGLAWM